MQHHGLADLHAPEVTYKVKNAPAAKKRGAVIGSAPKLNAEGLLAAARAAQEKEERQRAQVRPAGSCNISHLSTVHKCLVPGYASSWDGLVYCAIV